MILGILNEFEDLFDGNLVRWDTEPVNIELKPDSKPFDNKYQPTPIIKKETLRKDLQ